MFDFITPQWFIQFIIETFLSLFIAEIIKILFARKYKKKSFCRKNVQFCILLQTFSNRIKRFYHYS